METLLVGYIDPASGTLLLQLVLAGIVGGFAYFWRSISRVLGSLFRVIRSKREDE